MILILGGAWQGKLTWAASHGMVGPMFDLKDGWPEAPVRCCRHLEALTRASSDRGETAQQVLDRLLPHLHLDSEAPEGLPARLKRTTMLVLAVTLHNIPEGMAVGLSFAVAAQDMSSGSLAAAMALALGMALQNFPEGAAVALPLRSEGLSKGRSFVYGALSGVVEPIFGLLTVLAAGSISGVMPWLLSLAAGAMVYVVVEELIPEMSEGAHSNVGTLLFAAGFTVMMMLDVALG